MKASIKLAAAALIAALALQGQTQAALILSFSQNSGSNTVTAVNNGGSPNASTTISGADIVVSITGNNLGLGLGTEAYLTFSVTSIGPVVPVGLNLEQPFSGTFSITSAVGGGGTNYLSGSFTDAVFGSGASLTLQAAQPPESVVFTSDIAGAPLFLPRSLAWSFTNVTPAANVSNNSLGSFTASISGNFSGSYVPEAGALAVWAMLSVAGLAGVRRR